MAKRAVSLRLDPGLWDRVSARAGELGQSKTVFVERALEKALATEGGGGSPGVSHPVLPASSRTPDPEVEAVRAIADAEIPAETPLPKYAPRRTT